MSEAESPSDPNSSATSKRDRRLTRWNELRACRRELPPPLLYRYRTFDAAVTALSTSRLWWSCPTKFNDPFDGQWDTLWPIRTAEYASQERKTMRRLLTGEIELPPSADPEYRDAISEQRAGLSQDPVERDRQLDDFFLELQRMTSESRARMEERQASLIRRTRVLCMSEPFDCPVLWGHYGDSHKGVALGLDTQGLEEGLKVLIERVSYSRDLPRLIDTKEWLASSILGGELPKFYGERLWATHKSSAWAYEREWRALFVDEVEEPPGLLVPLPRGCLSEVVFGCRFEAPHVHTVKALARMNNPRCRFIHLRQANDSFSLAADIGQ